MWNVQAGICWDAVATTTGFIMSTADDFRSELPTVDVCLGKTSSIRIYGFSDIQPRLVEMRINRRRVDEVVRLTVDQARALASGLIVAAERASRC